MQTERRVAANPQTKPTDLGCESAGRLLSSADTIAIYYYYSARNVLCTKDRGLSSCLGEKKV